MFRTRGRLTTNHRFEMLVTFLAGQRVRASPQFFTSLTSTGENFLSCLSPLFSEYALVPASRTGACHKILRTGGQQNNLSASTKKIDGIISDVTTIRAKRCFVWRTEPVKVQGEDTLVAYLLDVASILGQYSWIHSLYSGSLGPFLASVPRWKNGLRMQRNYR